MKVVIAPMMLNRGGDFRAGDVAPHSKLHRCLDRADARLIQTLLATPVALLLPSSCHHFAASSRRCCGIETESCNLLTEKLGVLRYFVFSF